METKLNRICQVDLSTFCNVGCPWCNNSVMKRQKGFIDIELVKKLIEKIKGRQNRILLCFYGDPFLHPNFFEIVELFHKNGIKTVAKTSDINVLNDENIEKIANSHLENIYVTMNRFNPREQVEKLRKKLPSNITVTICYINLPKDRFNTGILKTKELLAWKESVEKNTGKSIVFKTLPYNSHTKEGERYDCCMRLKNGDCVLKKDKNLSMDYTGKLFYCAKDYELKFSVVGELDNLDNIVIDSKCIW